MLPASIAPSAAPGADDGVQLVDEQDDLALGGVDLLQHRLQPFLELAAVLGPGDQRAHVQRDNPLVLEPLGHVAAHDALGQPLDDGRLADARLADQHGVVLRPPGEDLDDAPDFLVAPDDRVELALAGRIGQVAAVLVQRLVGRLGVLRRHALAPSDLGQGCEDCLASPMPAAASSRVAGLGGWVARMVSSRCSVETYSSCIRSASGWLSDRIRRASSDRVSWAPVTFGELRQLVADRWPARGRAAGSGGGEPGELVADPFGHGRWVVARALQDGRNDAFGLLHQGVEQVQRLQLGVAFPLGQILGSRDGLVRLLREPFRAHQRDSRGSGWGWASEN